jgi:hypothetical protein
MEPLVNIAPAIFAPPQLSGMDHVGSGGDFC